MGSEMCIRDSNTAGHPADLLDNYMFALNVCLRSEFDLLTAHRNLSGSGEESFMRVVGDPGMKNSSPVYGNFMEM